ncbi:MAG: hypothetical protein ACRC8S_18860 [Fimbriiglobus sp.]
MVEGLLPSVVMDKASLRGNEYAWPLADVPEAIAAAKSLGLATLGGQVQFRTPEGTCELYWLNADTTDRLPDESWVAFVARSADQVSRGVAGLVAGTDFVAEGVKNFGNLAELRARGVALDGFLCFVLYFQHPQSKPGDDAAHGGA